MINRTEILNFLRSNKDYFKVKYNIIKIGLFGSYARDEQTDTSDIDIIVLFDDNTEDLFDKRFALREYIKSKFNKKVDVCHEQAIKPVFRELIFNETEYAY